jgi:hypothetical protein
VLEAERGRRLVEFERRRAFASDGHLSASAWLSHRQGLAPGVADVQVRVARALSEMPVVAEAFGTGEVSGSAVRVLARAREACPDAFEASEEAFVEVARTMAFGELRRVVDTWRIATDPDRALENEDRLFERRTLNVSPALDGMLRVEGELDPEAGQTLITALRAVTDVEARSSDRPDLRTPTQRHADALGEVCRQWLGSLDRPTVAGERPNVVVTVDLEALETRAGGQRSEAEAIAGGRSALEDAGPITPETVRRLACDANVIRVISGPASEPLDVGRRTKVVPPSLRRTVTVRDRGCRFPGCGRPPGWCDAHHVRHWADGGETALGNLVLLCRPHHRAIHRGFGVEMVEGAAVFRRPDGSPLEDGGRPP